MVADGVAAAPDVCVAIAVKMPCVATCITAVTIAAMLTVPNTPLVVCV